MVKLPNIAVASGTSKILVTVIILQFNEEHWLESCGSRKGRTISTLKYLYKCRPTYNAKKW